VLEGECESVAAECAGQVAQCVQLSMSVEALECTVQVRVCVRVCVCDGCVSVKALEYTVRVCVCVCVFAW